MTSEAITTDDRLPLRDAAPLFPGRPHFSTMWRWARRGVLTRNKQRVRLRTWKVGSQLYTSPAAVEQFITDKTQADDAAYQAEAGELSPQRRAAIDAAGKRCDQAGVTAA